MKIDELTRELHRQADEVAAGPPPSMARLRARRARRRRTGTVLAVAATAMVLGGTATVIGQVQSAGSRPAEPAEQPSLSDTTTPTAPDGGRPELSRSWTVVDCNPPDFGGCVAPTQLSFDDEVWNDTSGGSQPAHAPNGLNRAISLSTQGPRGPLLALVGARRAGPGSHLVLVADGERVATLPTGRLSAWRLPEGDRPGTLTVRDTGTPAQHETMMIELYVPAP